MKTMSLKLYEQLTLEERLRLTLAAMARDDVNEMLQLRDRAPHTSFTGIDPQYFLSLSRLSSVVNRVVRDWMEVSYMTAIASDKDCRGWIASWNAHEAAITRFCADKALTRDAVLALTDPLPEIIDVTRRALKAAAPPNRRWPTNRRHEHAVYQRLCAAWSPCSRN